MHLCNKEFKLLCEVFRVAEESAFIIGADKLRDRVQTAMEVFFFSQGVRQCYASLIKRNLIHDDTF